MIDAMFQTGTDAALDDQVARPKPFVPDEPGFSFGALTKAPFQGISSGSTKTAAFAAEILGAFGDVAGSTGADNRGGMFALATDEERKQQDAARRKWIDSGPQFSNEAGDMLRASAKAIMPDPTQTHAAAQVVAGIAEFATQAVSYAAGAGPLAPALLAGDVGLAEADKLKQQGVDLSTRTQAGAVAGAVAGASIALPVAVPGSVAKTAALVAVGGPGGFVAQNAAERAIIKNAGYDKIADQYDPLDPVGLTLSTLVPAGFGAMAVRGARVAPKPASNQPRGVRNNNPGNIEAGSTQWQGQVGSDGRFATFDTPEGGIRALGVNLLTYQEKHGLNTVQEIINRWAPPGENNTGTYVAAVAKEVGVGPTDRINLRDPTVLRRLTGAIVKHENGSQPYSPDVLRAGVDLALSGRAPTPGPQLVRIAVAAEPDLVAAARVQQTAAALDALRLTPDADIAGQSAHVSAVETAHEQLASGSPVAVSDVVRLPESIPTDRPYVEWSNQLPQWLEDLRTARRNEPVAPATIASRAIENVAARDTARGTDNLAATGKTSPIAAALDELIPQLTGKQPGQLVHELQGSGKLSPLANNAIVGLVETKGEPRALAQLVSHADQLAKAAPGRPHADSLADAIEHMRQGALKPATEAKGSATSSAAADVATANPDMPLRASEDGRTHTASEELERVRREAAEGTDTELGSDDASLIQVAANCFLSTT